MIFLPRLCNDSCLVKNPDGTLRCRKLYNIIVVKDNTRHQFNPLPNDYSFECLQILQLIGLIDKLYIDDDKNDLKFKTSLPFFRIYRYVLPTNPTNYINISPVEGYTFSVCKSIQNFQVLTGTGGCSKYFYKYIVKILQTELCCRLS